LQQDTKLKRPLVHDHRPQGAQLARQHAAQFFAVASSPEEEKSGDSESDPDETQVDRRL
jgi:hypothetical protein